MIAHQLGVVDVHEHAVVNIQITEPIRNLDILLHRATQHTDFPIELLRHVKNDLQAVNRRSERRDDDATARLGKDFLERRNDRAL